MSGTLAPISLGLINQLREAQIDRSITSHADI
jgi:hypothetical protein